MCDPLSDIYIYIHDEMCRLGRSLGREGEKGSRGRLDRDLFPLVSV